MWGYLILFLRRPSAALLLREIGNLQITLCRGRRNLVNVSKLCFVIVVLSHLA